MAICNQLNEQLETMIWLDVMHDPMLLNFHPISISHHNVFVLVLPKKNRRSSEGRVDLGIFDQYYPMTIKQDSDEEDDICNYLKKINEREKKVSSCQ